MIALTPEATVRNISDIAQHLEQDVEHHQRARDILPEIRDMRRLLMALEDELIERTHDCVGDAC